MGIEVLPPDVNESQSDFAVVDGKIRFGLTAVKSVGDGAVRTIIEARDERPFESIWDFCERVDAAVAEQAHAGEPDRLRRARLHRRDPPGHDAEVLEQALAAGQKIQEDAWSGQGSIFDMRATAANGSGPVTRSHPPVSAQEWARDELLRREKEVLGLYVSSHPLAPLRDQLARKVDVPLRAFADLPDGQVVTVGGIVAGVRQLVTKKGDTMAFVELDDVTDASRWSCSRRPGRPPATC